MQKRLEELEEERQVILSLMKEEGMQMPEATTQNVNLSSKLFRLRLDKSHSVKIILATERLRIFFQLKSCDIL